MITKILIIFMIINNFSKIISHDFSSNKRPRFDLTPPSSPSPLKEDLTSKEMCQLDIGLRITTNIDHLSYSTISTPESPVHSTPIKSPLLNKKRKEKSPKITPVQIPTQPVKTLEIKKDEAEILSPATEFLNKTLEIIKQADINSKTCYHKPFKLSIVPKAIETTLTHEKTEAQLLHESNPYRSSTTKSHHFVFQINKSLEKELLNQSLFKK